MHKQRALVRTGWHKDPMVEASHSYWGEIKKKKMEGSRQQREGGEADGPVTRVIWVWEPGLGMDLYSF